MSHYTKVPNKFIYHNLLLKSLHVLKKDFLLLYGQWY